MGASRQRKVRFLAAHPACCFCAGAQPATTIDHAPPRSFFLGRNGPEGFEFPACQRCQESTRLDELAVSMFVRINDTNIENYDSAEMRRILEGVRNNLPHLMPFGNLSARDKRNALRAKGLIKSAHALSSDVPMVAVPAAIDPHVHRYARKLALALYYREKGHFAPPGAWLWTQWAQAADQRQMRSFLEVSRMSPFLTIGSRANLNFGDRFGYRCDKADNNELFTAVAQFGQGLVVAMLVGYGLDEDEINEGWVEAATMFD